MFSNRSTPGGLVLTALVAGALLASDDARAQDSHHWTLQYGNMARLLGGAVVGSANDLSTVYYNPGRLALIGRPELLLSGSVIEVTNANLEVSERDRVEISDTQVSLSPSLIAGEARLGFLGKSRLAYSFLTRQSSDFDAKTRVSISVPDASSGVLARSDDIRARHKVVEQWGGLTWAYPVTEEIGVGASAYIASREHRATLENFAHVVTAAGGSVVSIFAHDFDYSHWHFVGKLGASARIEEWDVGATVTFPSVSLGGSGAIGFDNTLQATGPGTQVSASPYVAVDFQDGLDAEHRLPLSLALGFSRAFGDTRLHFAGEYFAPVDRYVVIDAEDFTSQTSGQPVDPDVTHELDTVVNLGIGLEHRFRDTFTGYASIRTDFSGTGEDPDTNMSFTRWDLYHFAAGATFRVRSSDVTIGAVVATGKADALLQLPTDVESGFFRATVIVGLRFPFGESAQ